MKKTKEGGESIAVVKTFHSQIDSKHCSSVWRSSFPDHLGICWKLYTLPETPNHLVCTLPLFLSVTVPQIAVPNTGVLFKTLVKNVSSGKRCAMASDCALEENDQPL